MESLTVLMPDVSSKITEESTGNDFLSLTNLLFRWADKDYNKSHSNSKWRKPFAGSSHAAGIVVEKVAVEAKQPNSAVRKCVRV